MNMYKLYKVLEFLNKVLNYVIIDYEGMGYVFVSSVLGPEWKSIFPEPTENVTVATVLVQGFAVSFSLFLIGTAVYFFNSYAAGLTAAKLAKIKTTKILIGSFISFYLFVTHKDIFALSDLLYGSIISNNSLESLVVIKKYMLNSLVDSQNEIKFLGLSRGTGIVNQNLDFILRDIVYPENKIIRFRIRVYRSLLKTDYLPKCIGDFLLSVFAKIPKQPDIDALLQPYQRKGNSPEWLNKYYTHTYFQTVNTWWPGKFKPMIFHVTETEHLYKYYRLMCEEKRDGIFVFPSRYGFNYYKTRELRAMLGHIPRVAYIRWYESPYHLGYVTHYNIVADIRTKELYAKRIIVGIQPIDEFC